MSIADPGKVEASALAALKEAWLNGMPVLATNGGAAIIGGYYIPQTMIDDDGQRIAVPTQTLADNTGREDGAGIGFLNATFVPRIMEDNRWGEMFSLAYRHPELLSLGLPRDGAIEIDQDGARSIGDYAIFVMDFRKAVLGMGSNNNPVIANGLLDIFTRGQSITPQAADINAAPSTPGHPGVDHPVGNAAAYAYPAPYSYADGDQHAHRISDSYKKGQANLNANLHPPALRSGYAQYYGASGSLDRDRNRYWHFDQPISDKMIRELSISPGGLKFWRIKILEDKISGG